MQHRTTPAGPLTTSKALRRATGTHAVLAEFFLADLADLLLVLVLGSLAGALLVPPISRLLQFCGSVLHASLPLDIVTLVLLCCLAVGMLREWVQHQAADAAWGCAIAIVLVAVGGSLILYVVQRSWIVIPSPILPPVTITPLIWSPPPSPSGLLVAAGLYLLAHLKLWQRERRETAEKVRTFSRAHEGGRLCQLLEQIYDRYRESLARFDPPPVAHLLTPRMVYFFPRRQKTAEEDESEILAHPEREIYRVGRELVICDRHLGYQKERLAIVMPLVARLLHDYNSAVALVEQLLRMAELARSSKWCYLLLPIPLIVARGCSRRWQAVERERALDRDEFAWLCGQGGLLRTLLTDQLADLHSANRPDTEIPSLAERIDHLDSLRNSEGRQVKELRAMLSLPPTSPTH